MFGLLRQLPAAILSILLAARAYSFTSYGNTISSNSLGYAYDFENHLIQQGGLSITYDCASRKPRNI
jgi:uncharacterized membrane protein YphA (DoxX/SURF4 family)